MNKKLTTVMVSIGCAVVLGVTAYATSLGNTNLTLQESAEYDEITSVIQNSGTVEAYLEPDSTPLDDEMDNSINSAVIQSVPSNINMNDFKKVKLFTVDINESITSIYDNLNTENEYWLAVIEDDTRTGYAYLRKGISYSEAESNLARINISPEWKSRMLKKIKEREGKWYVERVVDKTKDENARNFVNDEYVNSFLASEGISNIEGIKYIQLNAFIPAICVKTDSTEYIIPHFSGNIINGLQSDAIYTVSELKNIFLG